MVGRTTEKLRNQRGFSVFELLAVVGILVVLLALSALAVPQFLRQLQITELDNAAREIYMAAQNRAVLLRNDDALSDLVIHADGENKMSNVDVTPDSNETTQITAYYIHCDDPNIKELLPEESIDPALWAGDFYLVYEPESASVTDVFYNDTTLPVTGTFYRESGNDFYQTWRAREKSLRMENKPMVGYYGGDAAESGTTISLRTPVINIYNEESLWVEVTYWLPQQLRLESSNVDLEVTLRYQDREIPLEVYRTRSISAGLEYNAYTYRWTLDSLSQSEPQFKDLFGDDSLALGDDFTITAEVSYTGTRKVNGAKKTATDNSLFAKGSGDTIAYIENQRHLQNLSTVYSQVSADKTGAQQIDSFVCDSDYAFLPIENSALTSYDGRGYDIRKLTVDGVADGKASSAGLFGSVEGMELTDIVLIDPTVKGNDLTTGTLVGEGTDLTIQGCRVYWEKSSAAKSNLRDLLGDSEEGFLYQTTSTGITGGLVGALASSSITDSFAATTIQGGANPAGGLIGSTTGDVTITGSYADCYLQGQAVSGLVGRATGTAGITESYAAGFLETVGDSGQAAGIALGGSQVTMDRCYSVMLFSQGHTRNYPLCQAGAASSYDRCYYLSSSYISAENDLSGLSKTYAALTDQSQWEDLFGSGSAFAAKSAAESSPYNLQTTLSLTTYPYPGLKDLDHYGDWGAEFQNGSLVYYERYLSTSGYTYGFNGANLSLLGDEDDYAVKDGYAIAFRSTDVNLQGGTTVTVTYPDETGKKVTTTLSYQPSEIYSLTRTDLLTGVKELYFLLPLPGEMVNTSYVSKDFYQEITFSHGTGMEQVTGHYYYNPHFANAIVPYEDDLSLSDITKNLAVEIRTPRHLYMLSERAGYASSQNRYQFLQELNLDYTVYTGYDIFTNGFSQAPIGKDLSSPFRGTYDGQCHTIENAVVETDGSYMGLFGCSTGTIENVAYIIKDNSLANMSSTKTNRSVYAGGLVAYNSGSIRNSAVADMEIDLYAYQYSTVYAGGLVGWNQGTITGCSAALDGISVDATLSSAYVGGFVGTNARGGTIASSYAVGHVTAARSRYGSVYAGGFAGANTGTLRSSYAGCDLTVSGGAGAYGFSKDTSINCAYLNGGNFVYNNENYTAQYDDPSATPLTWGEMVSDSAANQLGMGTNVASYTASLGDYPYPGTVRDAKGGYIHYGKRPDLMDLGDGGIYYWEKMVTYATDANGDEIYPRVETNVAYHFSVAAVRYDDSTIFKTSTLSNAHDDDRVVTEYGYGYYNRTTDSDTRKATLTSSGLGFGSSTSFAPGSKASNTAANDAFYALMEGGYTFHSYNTWGTETAGEGLYPTSNTSGQGTWTLSYEGKSVRFLVAPFFADSMSVTSSGYTLDGVSAKTPGSSEDNPYGVRSIDQLQFINWNSSEKNTSSALTDKNYGNFPYLGTFPYSTASTNGIYYWKQSHDLMGDLNQTYSPIAAYYDADEAGTANAEATVYGWFGGSYDGQSYSIKEVNIQNTKATCVGLFGVTYNAELKNIILYSPSGKATVTGSSVGWYAQGGLVGLAAQASGSSRSITNCSVAGYTILDQHSGPCGYGGGGVGGLVGICNMELKGCSAVTDIQLDFRQTKVQVGDRSIRVGGLAGSCQQSISYCYAGGTISYTKTAIESMNNSTSTGKKLRSYAGGIIGGVFMKSLKNGGGSIASSGSVAISNCYSYVELPSKTYPESIKTDKIEGLYAIGGTADVSKTFYITNCYYLTETVKKNNQTLNDPKTPTEKTYSQMTSSGFLDELNATAAADGMAFGMVTTTSPTGEAISGKYSLASQSALLGMDYPFPTILTQENQVTGSDGTTTTETVNVHYGDWPIGGVQRENGTLPIELDLFDDYDESSGGAVYAETLTLSSIAKSGGTYQVTVTDPYDQGGPIDSVTLTPGDRTAALRFTAKRAGDTQIIVSYTADGTTYPDLTIDVYVTADLELLPGTKTILMFPDETAQATLSLQTEDRESLPQSLLEQIQLESFSPHQEEGYLSQAEVSMGEDGQSPSLTLVSLEESGQTQLSLEFTFSYLGESYTCTTPIPVEINSSAVTLEPLHIYLNGAEKQTLLYTPDQVKIQVDGIDQAAEGVSILDLVDSGDKDLVHATWTDSAHSGVSITGHRKDGAEETSAGYPQLQIRFQYGGCTHTLWEYLTVYVHQDSEENEQTDIQDLPTALAELWEPGEGEEP